MNNKSLRVIQHLRNTMESDWGFNPEESRCIELFARTGDWHTKELFKGCKDITLLEIDNKYESELKSNFPKAKIHITDSIVWTDGIEASGKSIREYQHKFNFVSVDNHLGCYGNYCENFEIINHVDSLLADDSVLLVNIVSKPYGKRDSIWNKKRTAFYGIPFVDKLEFNTILNTYRNILDKKGLTVEDYEYICREYAEETDYFYYLCLKLKRK